MKRNHSIKTCPVSEEMSCVCLFALLAEWNKYFRSIKGCSNEIFNGRLGASTVWKFVWPGWPVDSWPSKSDVNLQSASTWPGACLKRQAFPGYPPGLDREPKSLSLSRSSSERETSCRVLASREYS